MVTSGGRMGDLKAEISKVLREVVAPLVRADGGELYLVDANDESVILHLSGRFSGCPGNTLATRRVIEPAIFAVAPRVRVTVTSGPLIPKGAERIEK
jgi:Fe-S cluster biogenesis protein NfuA